MERNIYGPIKGTSKQRRDLDSVIKNRAYVGFKYRHRKYNEFTENTIDFLDADERQYIFNDFSDIDSTLSKTPLFLSSKEEVSKIDEEDLVGSYHGVISFSIRLPSRNREFINRQKIFPLPGNTIVLTNRKTGISCKGKVEKLWHAPRSMTAEIIIRDFTVISINASIKK